MEFYYNHNDEVIGPLPLDKLPRGVINEETLVWCEGMADWLPAAEVPEMERILHPVAIPPAMPDFEEREEMRRRRERIRRERDLERQREAAVRPYHKFIGLAVAVIALIMFFTEFAVRMVSLSFLIYPFAIIGGFVSFAIGLEANKLRLDGRLSAAVERINTSKIINVIIIVLLLLGIWVTIDRWIYLSQF